MVDTGTDASRRKPKQARSIQTVERTLAAAGAVLERDGFDGFSMQAVATEANLAIGTLYQYFPDKYAILKDLVERWYSKPVLYHADSLGKPDVEAQAEVYLQETGGPALLDAMQAVPELREYDRMKMDEAVERNARRIAGGGAPTRDQIAKARVTVFAVDGVLREVTRQRPRDARKTIAVLKKWIDNLYVDKGG